LHSLVGDAETRKYGYHWILDQHYQKLDIAMNALHSYVGLEQVLTCKPIIGENYVDLVRCDRWDFPLNTLAQTTWNSFTQMCQSSSVRKVTVSLYILYMVANSIPNHM